MVMQPEKTREFWRFLDISRFLEINTIVIFQEANISQRMRIVRKITIVNLGGKWLGNWFADQMRWDGVGENGDFMMLEIVMGT